VKISSTQKTLPPPRTRPDSLSTRFAVPLILILAVQQFRVGHLRVSLFVWFLGVLKNKKITKNAAPYLVKEAKGQMIVHVGELGPLPVFVAIVGVPKEPKG
jgi:hypothetical protein